MNRRSYLKGVLIFLGTGLASFSLFKWFENDEPLNLIDFNRKKELLEELVDLIIPETDTPGAREAKVHQYIINVIVNCNSIKQQRKFYSGLQSLEEHTMEKYGQLFSKCSDLQKSEILSYFSDRSGYSNRIINKINNKLFGEPFYSQLRRLTVEGYCLSFLGATKELAYDYIPGEYEACVPLLANQKSWATK